MRTATILIFALCALLLGAWADQGMYDGNVVHPTPAELVERLLVQLGL